MRCTIQKMARIEQVPGRKEAHALRFVAGGSSQDSIYESQAKSMMLLIRRFGGAVWWAVDESPLAAAAVVINPGKTAFLFHTPLNAPGLDRGQLVQLVRMMCIDQISRGVSLVQSLVDPNNSALCSLLREAGMIDLAGLSYMRRMLPHKHLGIDHRVQWLRYGQYSESMLGELIACTYRDSLDCPAISRLRRMEDVIAGHKASGVFTPGGWLVATVDGAPAGCILVNDVADGLSSEVVYMGVHPDFRRRGLATCMLRRACDITFGRGIRRIELAVDTRNEPALKVYCAEGFAEVQRRLALAMLRGAEPASRGRIVNNV